MVWRTAAFAALAACVIAGCIALFIVVAIFGSYDWSH